jgi:hypothetical protein
MVWVIAFKDVKVEYWREEFYFKDEFMGYGKVKTFKDKNECEAFIIAELDSKEYDFYSTEITDDELNDYETKK